MYLQDNGADVDATEDPERQAFRDDLGIPSELGSCHTAVVDGYALEGHIPAAAVTTLLDERPDAVGLALPGMPGDSPGMGGNETTWNQQPVLLVHTDGTTTPFDYS